MSSKYFFSVCTEVTNRANTIIRTIQSIENQTFQNFEYILVDNNSNDDSYSVIYNYIKTSCTISDKIKLIKRTHTLSDIKSWNEPLKYATGTYIVVCEGDDWFEVDHLQNAFNVLNVYNNIGIYVSLNKKMKSNPYSISGLIENDLLMQKLLYFDFVPPPSEVIFLRKINNQTYIYDDNNYVYAAEYSLYYKILKSNLVGYININSKTVNRGISQKKKIYGYFHIQDAYYSFNSWKNEYKCTKDILEVRYLLLKMVTKKILCQQIRNFTIEKKLIQHIYSESKFIGKFKSFFTIFQIIIKSFFTYPWNIIKNKFSHE